MANLGKVVYLSEEQKQTLFTNGSVTVGGVTITYSENDLYVTPSSNADSVTITDTTPSSATSYYPIYASGVSGEQVLRANNDLYYYDTGTSSYLNVGSSSHLGGLTLHQNNGKYVNFAPGTITANRNLTLPDKSGTIAVESDLNQYSPLFPNYDDLTPVATYNYTTSAAAYYRFASRTNSGLTDSSEFDDIIMFRITVTGTGINEIADVFVQGSRVVNTIPIAFALNRTLSASAATTGIRYLRFIYPKELNNGYNWEFELYPYNATARTIKIEVFKTTSNVTWESSLVATTYDSDYQASTSMTLYTSRGLCALGTVPIGVSSASTSTYITGYLPLFTGGTQPVAGQALTANSLILFSGNKAYKASNKTVAITPEVGLAFLSNATSSGSALSYNYVRQKGSWTTLTGDSAMSHATIARGNPVYLRCTIDSNGNIKSDAYLSPTMAAGYTWCYVGVAQSSSAINVDCTHPLFLTLDSNGKLTHINGKALNGGVTSVNGQTGTVTIDVPTAYASNPSVNGTASAGSSSSWSRGDHVHPTDTTRAATTTVPTQASVNSSGLITYKNSSNTSLFTLQLPLYDGGSQVVS